MQCQIRIITKSIFKQLVIVYSVSYLLIGCMPSRISITPEVNGRFEYNNLAVKGIPKIIGDIEVFIKGGMISTGWNMPSDFEKVYIIQVIAEQK